MKSNKTMKKVICLIAAFSVAFSGLTMTTAQAAVKKVTKVTVKAGTKTLYVGGPASYKKTKLKVTVKPKSAKNKKVAYKSSNKKIVTVTSKGKVTAKRAGKAKITVTARDGSKKKATISIRVKKYVKPKTLTVKASKTTLTTSQTATIKSTVKPSKTTNKKVTYKSSNQAIKH